MKKNSHYALSLSAESFVIIERRRQYLQRELDDIRLALCALNLDAPYEAQSALLYLIDGRLRRLITELVSTDSLAHALKSCDDPGLS
ncbi:hypothetical protein [Microbulbifer discodermiae]|uniref:hypothetical protein n=1 Tax=Microbulbifer sp. 2201CG32-9 TaxID=3232309 RepID=UPI00345C4B82